MEQSNSNWFCKIARQISSRHIRKNEPVFVLKHKNKYSISGEDFFKNSDNMNRYTLVSIFKNGIKIK